LSFPTGTDHAGIATQLQVEKQLIAEGTSREEVGREVFLDRVWKYKGEQGGHITRQLRSLGASADWSRERFTMDTDLSEAVSEAFVRLHEKGLIYRGEYMVNWAPMLKTAVSDLEVEYSEEEGKLYFFKYMVEGSDGGKFSIWRFLSFVEWNHCSFPLTLPFSNIFTHE
jgi:valyl-tRNA synthetase